MNKDLNKAIELQRSGDLEGAVKQLKKAVSGGHSQPQVYYFLGAILDALKKHVEASKYLSIAVEKEPKNPEFWFSLGNSYSSLSQLDDAVDAFRHCIKLKSDHVHGLVNFALACQKSNRLNEACTAAKKAIVVAPFEKKAWLTLLGTMGSLRDFSNVKLCMDEALDKFPNDPDLLHMFGDLLTAEGLPKEGYIQYQKAYEYAPDHVKLLNSIGHYFSQNENGYDAIPYHQRALELNPLSGEAIHGLGTAYLKIGSPPDAVPHFLKAIELGCPNSDPYDALILAAQYLDNVVEEEIFQLHLDWENKYAKGFYPTNVPVLSSDVEQLKRRIRVGFVSADFRDHSVSRFMTALIQFSDESGMDAYFYSDVDKNSEYSKYLKELGGNWIHSLFLTDDDLANRIRNDEIDVLIDLGGHTGRNRLFVFARKPAPIQISWLGYPNTTGLKTVDFRFSDEIADPVGRTDDLSTEVIVRLEDGFHCFEPPIELPLVQMSPCLKNKVLTFGSFNNQSKISSLTVNRWVMLLNAIPDSRLLLKNNQIGDSRNQEHWSGLFEAAGVDPSRIDFIGYCKSLSDHYACYDRIDIAVDTFPYNGTTTTCEALWMGVPVLSIEGDCHRARTGASLLSHSGLRDWIVDSEQQWVERACYWNAHREELNALRLGLRKQVSQSPIGDGPRFAEKFYAQIKSLVLS